MKLFAFYLPQFHEIPENNKWWGDGFTEWTNVKKAKSLYRGHIQPIHPENDYYYNLLDKSTIEWQTKLMNDSGIDGMIYYHYYFQGKMLLEKPAENLLKWKDISQGFFFCWANHSWKRTWNGTSTMLLEQTYGTEEDWEMHFQYLLPFFKDERYEKKDNKPLFMLFAPEIEEKESIISYFDKRCKENGFDGIYFIETCSRFSENGIKTFNDYLCSKTQAIYVREPDTVRGIRIMGRYSSRLKSVFNSNIDGLKKFLKIQRIEKYSGDSLFEEMMNYEPKFKNPIRGLFFSWDNTPRHGKRGYVIKPVSKDVFFRYMDSRKDDEYMFINAWNEWCEGMILEPTKEYGTRYLDWIKEWESKQHNEK